MLCDDDPVEGKRGSELQRQLQSFLDSADFAVPVDAVAEIHQQELARGPLEKTDPNAGEEIRAVHADLEARGLSVTDGLSFGFHWAVYPRRPPTRQGRGPPSRRAVHVQTPPQGEENREQANEAGQSEVFDSTASVAHQHSVFLVMCRRVSASLETVDLVRWHRLARAVHKRALLAVVAPPNNGIIHYFEIRRRVLTGDAL